MNIATTVLPRWDRVSLRPDPGPPASGIPITAVDQAIDAVRASFDQHGIGLAAEGDEAPSPIDIDAMERVLSDYDAVMARINDRQAYLECLVSLDADDAAAQAEISALQPCRAALALLRIRLEAWAATIPFAEFASRSALVRRYAALFRWARKAAAHHLHPSTERLAAELEIPGAGAWIKLYRDLTTRHIVRLDCGEEVTLPLAVVRDLANDAPARSVRARAHEAECEAWRDLSLPLAASLNSVKGVVVVLARQRGWDTPLDMALDKYRMDRASLAAMQEAVADVLPILRRYLRAKATHLGVPSLAWYDRYAVVGVPVDEWPFERASTFIIDQFGTYSPTLRNLAERAMRERWIDAAPAPHKGYGAACLPFSDGTSRIFLTYRPSLSGMGEIAHELGHAYHNACLSGIPMALRAMPLPLAETASLFCETLIIHAARRAADPPAMLALLDSSLQTACLLVADQMGLFTFEQRLFAERAHHELAADDLCAMMLDAQRDIYGTGLDESVLHPYRWAAVGQLYSASHSFYNIPYTIGYLFALSLYAHFQDDRAACVSFLDHLLAVGGQEDMTEVAASHGCDLRAATFWHGGTGIIAREVSDYVALLQSPHV